MKNTTDRVRIVDAVLAGADPRKLGFTPVHAVTTRGNAAVLYVKGTPVVVRTNHGLLLRNADTPVLCRSIVSDDLMVVSVARNAAHPVEVETAPTARTYGGLTRCLWVDMTCRVAGMDDPASAVHWNRWKAAIRKRVSAPVKPPCRKALVAMRTKRMNEKAKRRDEDAVQAFIRWCSDACGRPKASACMDRLRVWNTIDKMFSAARAKPRH